MDGVRIVDVTDAESFGLVPPCADPAFDHRSCDYWEDAERGSKLARAVAAAAPAPPPPPRAASLAGNPFAPAPTSGGFNPFLADLEHREDGGNPFLPAASRPARPAFGADAPTKLALLSRGLGVFGSYAKVLLLDDEPVGYTQFGPLSAYPRALRLRELYPQLPVSPLPAVITCIATTRAARGHGLARRLIDDVCRDLGSRGFSAVEAYPEVGAPAEATSSASPAFWEAAGFRMVVADARYPVFRRELE
jgi:GNAT superfamily N-acetyltransferase